MRWDESERVYAQFEERQRENKKALARVCAEASERLLEKALNEKDPKLQEFYLRMAAQREEEAVEHAKEIIYY